MAFLGITVPHETARLLSEIEVPGDPEPPDQFHITLLYLGDNIPMATIAEAMKATYEVTSDTRPFSVKTELLTCFPGGEDGVPVICKIESPALMVFRARLAEAFDQAGIEYSKRFPEFKPHMTLAYAPEPIVEQVIPPVEWGAHGAVLWAGDKADGRLTITFPFSLKAPKVLSMPPAARVASRFAGGGV